MNIFKFKEINKKRSVFKILYSEFGIILFIGIILFALLTDFAVHTIIFKNVYSAISAVIYEVVNIIVLTELTLITYVIIQNICIFIQYMIFVVKCSYLPFTEEEMEKLHIVDLHEYVYLLFDISKIKVFTHVFTFFPFVICKNEKYKLFDFPYIVKEELWNFISKRFYGEDIREELNLYYNYKDWRIFLSNKQYFSGTIDLERFYINFPNLKYYHLYGFKTKKDKEKKNYKLFKEKDNY